MTRDYAKNNKPSSRKPGNRKTMRSTAKKKPTKRTVPGWVWLFTGTILGAFVMFLIELSTVDVPNTTKTNSDTTSTPVSRKKNVPAKTEEPRFNFYERLKKDEVPIREDAQRPNIAEASKKDFQYLLQVASYRSEADAEALRVNLILLNMEATIESGQGRNGDIWHRVIVGPFTSRSKREKARSNLVSNNYEALVLTRPISK